MNTKLFIIVLFVILADIAFGQKNEVHDKLKKTLNTGISSKNYAVSTLSLITSYINTLNEKNLKQCFLSKPRNENLESIREIEDALNFASVGKKKAEELKCFVANDFIDIAISNFDAAKIEFENAANPLRTADNSEDINEIRDNFRTAKKQIEEGLKYLNNAISDLNRALEKSENCN